MDLRPLPAFSKASGFLSFEIPADVLKEWSPLVSGFQNARTDVPATASTSGEQFLTSLNGLAKEFLVPGTFYARAKPGPRGAKGAKAVDKATPTPTSSAATGPATSSPRRWRCRSTRRSERPTPSFRGARSASCERTRNLPRVSHAAARRKIPGSLVLRTRAPE